MLVWLGGFVGTGVFFAIGAFSDNEDWVIVLGLLGQYVGNLGVLWVLRRRKEDPDLGFQLEPKDTFYVGVGLVLQMILALVFLPLAELLFPDGRPPQQVADAIASSESSTLLRLSLVFAAVILAPVTEELIFRGVLIKALQQRSRTFIIVVTSAIFAAVHLLGLDFERVWASALLVLPPIFILGMILAWLTLKTGRLGPAIFLHSGWNLLAALVLLVPSEVLESIN